MSTSHPAEDLRQSWVGGAVALQFSLGQVGVGISQMINAFTPNRNRFLEDASTLPGLIAYGVDSKYAPFIDALGQLTPTITTSGEYKSFLSFKGMVNSGLGVIGAIKTFKNTPSIANAIAALDQISTVTGFTLESLHLYNKLIGGKMQQLLEYKYSYQVQKGDDLTKISNKLGISVDEIIKVNRIKRQDNIKVGEKLIFSDQVYGKEK